MKKRLLQCVAAGVVFLAATFPAHSESSEVKVARQSGIGYLQFMLMKQGTLIEKHADAQGVQDLTVRWLQVYGGRTEEHTSELQSLMRTTSAVLYSTNQTHR